MTWRPGRLQSLLLFAGMLLACRENDSAAVTSTAELPPERWYTSQQVDAGEPLFRVHCADCHGDRAQGLAEDWRQRLPDGSFPPPPLNGSAHAWHHPLSVLIQTIEQGGIPLGGRMPAFGDLLLPPERLAVVAYFQQFWSDEVYLSWLQMGGVN